MGRGLCADALFKKLYSVKWVSILGLYAKGGLSSGTLFCGVGDFSIVVSFL